MVYVMRVGKSELGSEPWLRLMLRVELGLEPGAWLGAGSFLLPSEFAAPRAVGVAALEKGVSDG